jgi:hypothetical protein
MTAMLGSTSKIRACLVSTAIVIGAVAAVPATASPTAASVTRFDHVVQVFLENESAGVTWEHDPGLRAIASSGLYIPGYYGVGHASLDNYEAAFGAVAPTTQGQADCLGMAYGTCIFPTTYPTIGKLLDQAGLPWKVYAEGQAGAPLGHSCLHALSRSLPDFYQGPLTNGYATRHNPAPWFDSVLTKGGSEAYCQAHNPDLKQLASDARSAATMPAFSFVAPDTCHDGHDTSSTGGCLLDPEGPTYPSGIQAIDAWLPGFIHQLTSQPWWTQGNNVLFVTFDEGNATDLSGCASCGDGSAGGRVGAVVFSPHIVPGTTSSWQGDHYGFLRTLETAWQLPSLKSTIDPSLASHIHDGDPGVTALAI